MKYKKSEVVCGVIILVIFSWFLSLLIMVKMRSASESYNINTIFNDASGVAVGSDVMLSGVKIGSVKSISVNDETLKANVKISIGNKYKFATDTMFSIESPGLFGAKFVNVTPGVDDELLSPNTSTNLTQSAVSLEKLISKFIVNKQ